MSSFLNTQVFDEAIVQVSSGQLVRLPELGSRLNVGDTGSVSSYSFLILEFKFTSAEYSTTSSKYLSKLVWTFTREKCLWRRQRYRHSRETQCICSCMARFKPVCKGYLPTLPFLIRTSILLYLHSLIGLLQRKNRDLKFFGQVKISGCLL
jgi:hypothetical protein